MGTAEGSGTGYACNRELALLIKTIMKALLRHARSGQYFQALGEWTPDREEAYDFGLIARALKFAHRSGIHGLELVLSFEEPERASAIPMERFRLGSSASRTRGVRGAGGGKRCCLAVNGLDSRRKIVHGARSRWP